MAKVFKASRLIGPFALVLGAMAFSAAPAQAELNAKWQVNGSDVTIPLKAQLQVTEIETVVSTGVKQLILLTKSGLTTVEILCSAMALVDALLEVLGAARGKFHYSGCRTSLNKKPHEPACVPHSPGAANGLIETNTLKALIKLHTGGVELIELLPETGGTFVTLQFGTGECLIGNNIPITGTFFLKTDAATELKENTVSKLFSKGPLSALLFGGNHALIDGSAKAALLAPHTGMTWNGKAG